MKKIGILSVVLLALLATGCGCSKKKENKNENLGNNVDNNEPSVIKDQIFEGLEFVNVSIDNGIVKTVVINNTGVKYEGSKFSMKILDNNSNVIVELVDEVKEQMATGTTKTIETKTDVDLSNASAIEYSIVTE